MGLGPQRHCDTCLSFAIVSVGLHLLSVIVSRQRNTRIYSYSVERVYSTSTLFFIFPRYDFRPTLWFLHTGDVCFATHVLCEYRRLRTVLDVLFCSLLYLRFVSGAFEDDPQLRKQRWTSETKFAIYKIHSSPSQIYSISCSCSRWKFWKLLIDKCFLNTPRKKFLFDVGPGADTEYWIRQLQ